MEQLDITAGTGKKAGYAWIILAACTLMIFITYGLIYSYSVFFKSLQGYFGWDRATVSMVYSLSVVIRGAAAIGAGWLADRYGARKILIVCGILMGAGYLVSSQITQLWHLVLSYAFLEAFGMSGAFGICTATVSRWFTRNRGLALGIVASGSGLGTAIVIPGVERLVERLQWDGAFIVCGIAAMVLMILASSFLKPPPRPAASSGEAGTPSGATVRETLRDSRFYLTMLCFLTFFFGTQIVMVHMVNYATDRGIDSFIAATVMSVIGFISIAGRLSTGIIADKIGVFMSMIITSVFMVISFILLLFSDSVWMFYLSAVMFSIPYGGEVTQIPLLIGRYFGTRSMSTLMGITLFIIGLGGALGPWVAGKLHDVTGSYQWAFITGAITATVSIFIVLLLKQRDRADSDKLESTTG